jgi:very-short-patch-repair endonuclease
MRESDPPDHGKRGRRELKAADDDLWTLLREQRFRNADFVRRHVIGPFAVDFASVSAKLVIELDANAPVSAEQAALDAERVAFVQRAGWRVLHINSDEVLAGDGAVYAAIEAALG